MKAYIACGLTHVPRNKFAQYVHFIHNLAQALQGATCAHVRYALKDSDPKLPDYPIDQRARLCYQWDKALVEWADVVVAEATYPSIGLGIELQIAEAANKPIILCFSRSPGNRVATVRYENPDGQEHLLQVGEGYITLMALGLPAVRAVVGYEDFELALPDIVEAVSTLGEK